MRKADRQAYRQHLAQTYDQRSASHEQSAWHAKVARKLLQEMPPSRGGSVLDLGTGTGVLAFAAAQAVGPSGRVFGVDISNGMLSQARNKRAHSSLSNLAFAAMDMEQLAFPAASFSELYCASAFFCVLDPLATLRHWHALLRPAGRLAFHAVSEDAYFWVAVVRKVLARHGYDYVLNTPTGNPEKIRRLVQCAGFSDVQIREEPSGHYVGLEQAKQLWLSIDDFAPGQYPHPASNVPDAVMQSGREAYEAVLDGMATSQGVWNDTTMYSVYLRK